MSEFGKSCGVALLLTLCGTDQITWSRHTSNNLFNIYFQHFTTLRFRLQSMFYVPFELWLLYKAETPCFWLTFSLQHFVWTLYWWQLGHSFRILRLFLRFSRLLDEKELEGDAGWGEDEKCSVKSGRYWGAVCAK